MEILNLDSFEERDTILPSRFPAECTIACTPNELSDRYTPTDFSPSPSAPYETLMKPFLRHSRIITTYFFSNIIFGIFGIPHRQRMSKSRKFHKSTTDDS